MSRLLDDIRGDLEFVKEVTHGTFQIRVEQLELAARDAAEKGDEPKLIDLYEQLQGLHEEILREKVQLTPPWRDFEKIYGECLGKLTELKRSQPDYADQEIRHNLAATRSAAQAAFRDKDQVRYTGHVEAIRRARQSLGRELQRDIEDHTTPTERAAGLIDYGLKRSDELLVQASQCDQGLEEKARAERDPEARAALKNHLQQCEEARARVLGCKTEFEELKHSYTTVPNEASDRCFGLFPTLEWAANVLNQKLSVLEGKPARDERQGLPVDLMGDSDFGASSSPALPRRRND